MAIRPSLWLVLMSIAYCKDITFTLRETEVENSSQFYKVLEINRDGGTLDESGKSKEYEKFDTQSEDWSYKCLYNKASVLLKIMLRNKDAEVSDVYISKRSGLYKKLDGNTLTEQIEDNIYSICFYQGTWYPEGSNDPIIYINIDYGENQAAVKNYIIFRVEVVDKTVNTKLIKSIDSIESVKPKLQILAESKKTEDNQLLEKILMHKFDKESVSASFIVGNLNCELKSIEEHTIKFNEMPITNKGEGVFTMPIFTNDISVDKALYFAIGSTNPVYKNSINKDLGTFDCNNDGFQFSSSDVTNNAYDQSKNDCSNGNKFKILI